MCLLPWTERLDISGIHSNYWFSQARIPSRVTGTVLPVKQKNTSQRELEVAVTISQAEMPRVACRPHWGMIPSSYFEMDI